MAWRIGVDTGGTFTDVVALDSATGARVDRKIWSVRGEPGRSLAAAIDSLGLDPEQIESVVYGTTIVTNALIEGRLASTALLATRGFADVLEIARQKRDVLYRLAVPHRDPSPVPRERCIEVDERSDAAGRVLVAPDVGAALARLEELGARYDCVAISLLHAYANPANERALARAVRVQHPFVAVSHEVSPEAREYERTLVTVLNAGLLPMMAAFVGSLANDSVLARRLFLFHSAGGMVSPATAARLPLLLAMSGPAAGVEAACNVADQLRLPAAITLDMGGTTTDCSLILEGRAELRMEATIGRYAVRQPMVAVESIGAGSGSLVRITDEALTIGPDSAGSDPGPACYQRGGTNATLADAAAIAGYFGRAAGGLRELSISVDAAREAFVPIARRLARPVEQAAFGAIQVANAVAARALKRISIDRGVDARGCTLIAFGGAGPMFACLLAEEIGLSRIVVPAGSSALSAIGCLQARRRLTRQRTVRVDERDFEPGALEHAQRELRAEVTDELLAGEDRGRDIDVEHAALMRYAGQSYDIEIQMPAEPTAMALTTAFRARHEALYGYSMDEPWQCVALRVTATQGKSPPAPGPASQRSDQRRVPEQSPPDVGPIGECDCFFGGTDGWRRTLEYRRDDLRPGHAIAGPALVADALSTVIVAPNWSLKVQADGHLQIERQPLAA